MRPKTIHPDDCGNCKHWHEWPKEKQEYPLKLGDCDKIPKGKAYYYEDSNGEWHGFTYDGYSFEDENYNEDFNCFEPIMEARNDML